MLLLSVALILKLGDCCDIVAWAECKFAIIKDAKCLDCDVFHMTRPSPTDIWSPPKSGAQVSLLFGIVSDSIQLKLNKYGNAVKTDRSHIWGQSKVVGPRVGKGSRRSTRDQTFVTPACQTIHNMVAVIMIIKMIVIIVIIPTKEV